jgi:hypothetical protein
MEGFSMPLSNKRTVSLPNPHPIGLHSHCSILPATPPLGLHQARAPCQTHTQWDTWPSATQASSCWTHTTPEYLPLSHAHWDPSHQSTPDPIQELVPQLTGIPASFPSPLPKGPAGLQLHVERLEPFPAGTGTSLPGTLPFRWSQTKFYRLPR